MNSLTEISFAHTQIILLTDGIVQINASDRDYSADDIKAVNQAIGNLSPKGCRKLLLIIASNYTNADTEARNYMSTSEGTEFSIAEAYVIKSLAQRLILNFLIKVSKPNVPVQFFTDKQEAINWLYTMRNANN